MLPSGDDLTIILFLLGLAVTAGISGLTLLERKRKLITSTLFVLTILFATTGVGWPWLRDISPKMTEHVTQTVSNPVTWFVTIMFLAGLLLFSRVGDRPPAPQSASPSVLPGRHEDSLIAVRDIVIAAGLTPQTTAPALLLTKAAIPQHRLRVVLEHSRYFQSLGSAGWTASKQLALADIKDVIKGQEIRLPIVSCSADASNFWWGGENDAVGNQIEKAIRYRAKIRFIASSNEEQIYRLGLRRTTVDEKPYLVAVFTEQDLNF